MVSKIINSKTSKQIWKIWYFIKAIEKEKAASARDEEAFANDIAIVGRPTTTKKGGPIWVNSPAAKLLKEDIENGLNKNVAPKSLRITREEYQEFEEAEFRDRIYQNQRNKVERSYWLNRQSKKKKRQAEIS